MLNLDTNARSGKNLETEEKETHFQKRKIEENEKTRNENIQKKKGKEASQMHFPETVQQIDSFFGEML